MSSANAALPFAATIKALSGDGRLVWPQKSGKGFYDYADPNNPVPSRL